MALPLISRNDIVDVADISRFMTPVVMLIGHDMTERPAALILFIPLVKEYETIIFQIQMTDIAPISVEKHNAAGIIILVLVCRRYVKRKLISQDTFQEIDMRKSRRREPAKISRDIA